MPSFVTTIEDFSPVIVYSPDWGQGSSQSDPLASSYSSSSFFATNTNGGTASFTFNGTGVELFGAKRSNHGLYQVTLDGKTFPAASGESTNATFQQTLFSQTGLTQGLHTVILENDGASGQFVDLDYITWYGNIGESDEPLSVITVQDDDSSFVYSPSDAWSDTPPNLGFFSGSSGHATSTPGASLTYTFQGDGVSLYGPVGPNYAPYSVQLNGGALSFSAFKSQNASQVLLYHADNLGPGPHTLSLLFQPSSTGQTFAIDYAEVYTTPSIQASLSSGNSDSLSGGAIAGLVIGLLALSAFLLFGLWWYLRRRRDHHMRSFRAEPVLAAELGVKPEFGFPNPFPEVSGPMMYERQSSLATESRLIGGPTAPTFTDVASATLVAGDDRSDSTSHYASSTRSLTRSITNSTSPRRAPSGASSVGPFYSKSAGLTLPSAAGESLSGVSTEQLLASRMVVNGRPQDFGSITEEEAAASSSSGGGELSQSYTEHHPPPDYHQATEIYNS